MDSRTLLAALLAVGARFEVVTQRVRSPADVRVAGDICRYLGVRHHVIEPKPRDEARFEAWKEHTFGSYSDADDNLLLPQDQYHFLHSDAILLRANSFGIGPRNYAKLLHGLTFDNATGEELWRRFEWERPADPDSVRFFDEWLEAKRADRDQLDLVDACYNDQRFGGWLAALEQGLDLLPGLSVQPANSDRAKSALLTPPPEERATKSLQRAVIRDLEPKLARFPVNPKGVRHYAGAVRRRARRALGSLGRLLGDASRRAAGS